MNNIMNTDQSSIVIYGSEMERQFDQFWMENPEYSIYIMIGSVAFMIGAYIFSNIRHKHIINKYNRKWRK